MGRRKRRERAATERVELQVKRYRLETGLHISPASVICGHAKAALHQHAQELQSNMTLIGTAARSYHDELIRQHNASSSFRIPSKYRAKKAAQQKPFGKRMEKQLKLIWKLKSRNSDLYLQSRRMRKQLKEKAKTSQRESDNSEHKQPVAETENGLLPQQLTALSVIRTYLHGMLLIRTTVSAFCVYFFVTEKPVF